MMQDIEKFILCYKKYILCYSKNECNKDRTLQLHQKFEFQDYQF